MSVMSWCSGNVAPMTISRFENEQGQPIAATLAAIRAALEAAGVEFIAENGGGGGVRLQAARHVVGAENR